MPTTKKDMPAKSKRFSDLDPKRINEYKKAIRAGIDLDEIEGRIPVDFGKVMAVNRSKTKK